MIKSCGNNAQTIINYLKSLRNEINLSHNYERNNINTLEYLSKFHSNKKFKEMDKDDIVSFLNTKMMDVSLDPRVNIDGTKRRILNWILYQICSNEIKKF